MPSPKKLVQRFLPSRYGALNNVEEESEHTTPEKKKPVDPTSTTPINRRAAVPNDGFQQQKHQTRKDSKMNEDVAFSQACSTFSTNTRTRHMERNWLGVKQETREAKKVIDDNYAKAVRRGTDRSRQAARASQIQNDQGRVAKLGDPKGVKYEKERPTKTAKHGVPYSQQLPGKIGSRHDIYPLHENGKVKPGDPGTFPDREGNWFHNAGHFQIEYRRHDNTVNEVAVYTFGGTGLSGVPENERKEYINLMPPGMKEKDYTSQNSNAPTIKILTKLGRRDISSEKMVVRVTQISTRSVDCDKLEMVGELDQKGLKILLEEIAKAQGFEVKKE